MPTPRTATDTDFTHVRAYCMFIGYPRSGHSLVGSLLDAHPRVVIAHELDALQCVDQGASREDLYIRLCDNAAEFTRAGRHWNDYTYAVPNQWHGRFSMIEVIGDKKGGASTRRLSAHPELLGRVREIVQVPIKVVHVVRNPFDNIATMFKRQGRLLPSLKRTAKEYFTLCETNARLRQEADVFDLRHEAVIHDAATALRELCAFLDLEPEDDYLQDCASIVYASPHQSRHETAWKPRLIDVIQEQIERYDFLRGYTFAD